MILDGEKYGRILPGDYISYLQRLEGINNVQAALEMDNLVKNWVKHSVLCTNDLKTRSEILKFFVHTAKVTLTLWHRLYHAGLITMIVGMSQPSQFCIHGCHFDCHSVAYNHSSKPHI
jgi:hypothetical protein